MDPVVKFHESSYAAFANNPIWFVDPIGADTSFETSEDREFILDLVDKESENYDRRFAKKFKRLAKSDTNYHFASVKYDKDNNVKSGKTFVYDNEDKNEEEVWIVFTKDDNPNIKNYGMSEYSALYEETFHAWEYDKGRIDLVNRTVMQEARALKFASFAPGTKEVMRGKVLLEYGNSNAIEREMIYSFMFRVQRASYNEIAQWLKYGAFMIDVEGFDYPFGGYGKKDEKTGDWIGLYYNLPLR